MNETFFKKKKSETFALNYLPNLNFWTFEHYESTAEEDHLENPLCRGEPHVFSGSNLASTTSRKPQFSTQ